MWGEGFSLLWYMLLLHCGCVFASNEILSSPQRKGTVYKGLQCRWKWEAFDGTSMHEFICGFAKREEPHPKTEHQAKSHLSSTLSGHQKRNMGTPKVSWKSTILNCHEIFCHAVRPNEHATKIFKFPQKAYKDTLIIIRYTGTGLSRLWLSYRWFLPECMLSNCMLCGNTPFGGDSWGVVKPFWRLIWKTELCLG